MRHTQAISKLVSRRPSPAMMVALVALFISLTGNGLALSGKFTVDGNDLQRGAVHRYAIHENAVDSARIDNGAVHNADLGKVVIVSESTPLPDNTSQSVAASCPTGSQLLGGGGRTGLTGVPLTDSYPLSDGRWQADGTNDNSGANGTLTAYAICLK
jgi:hypothetical protein